MKVTIFNAEQTVAFVGGECVALGRDQSVTRSLIDEADRVPRGETGGLSGRMVFQYGYDHVVGPETERLLRAANVAGRIFSREVPDERTFSRADPPYELGHARRDIDELRARVDALESRGRVTTRSSLNPAGASAPTL